MSPLFSTMAEPVILALDTATEACSAALLARGEVTQRLEIAPRGHSGLAPDMAQELLREAGLELAQLDALAVDIGPGAFTGLRIGIGLAQGLAYGAGLKVIPVISLEALAFASAEAEALAAIDARMGQVYYGLYRNAPHGLECITPPTLAAPQQVRAGPRGGVIGVGSGWERYAPQLLAATEGAVAGWRGGQYPQAASVARLAASRVAISPLELCACYVRDEVARCDAQVVKITPAAKSPR